MQVKKMGKEGLKWGTVAGIYTGMEYGVERVRGRRDWVLCLTYAFCHPLCHSVMLIQFFLGMRSIKIELQQASPFWMLITSVASFTVGHVHDQARYTAQVAGWGGSVSELAAGIKNLLEIVVQYPKQAGKCQLFENLSRRLLRIFGSGEQLSGVAS
eukprot:Gb_05949 [translate_table: standard]